MSEQIIPYGSQWLEEDDIAAVEEVLEGDWLTTGPWVETFEKALADRCGARQAVAVSSGTAALHAAFRAVGVGPDTEVIAPALTFSATANAARVLGATIRFADITETTLTIDPGSVRELIGERTAAVVPVDFAGHPARLDAIGELAAAHGAAVVHDAAHSLGASFRGRPVGSIADVTTFSFHPVKAVTCGEGGAVVTDDAELAESIRRFRNHGMIRPVDEPVDGGEYGEWMYDIEQIGLNYRITDIQCALGLNQLRKLDRFIDRRRRIAARYRRVLAGVDRLELPPDRPWCEHAYHLFAIRVPARRRPRIFEQLRRRGIGVQVHYIPANMLSAYRTRGHHPEDTPRALRSYRRLISIPCFPKMSDGDVERVAAEIQDLMGGEDERQ